MVLLHTVLYLYLSLLCLWLVVLECIDIYSNIHVNGMPFFPDYYKRKYTINLGFFFTTFFSCISGYATLLISITDYTVYNKISFASKSSWPMSMWLQGDYGVHKLPINCVYWPFLKSFNLSINSKGKLIRYLKHGHKALRIKDLLQSVRFIPSLLAQVKILSKKVICLAIAYFFNYHV